MVNEIYEYTVKKQSKDKYKLARIAMMTAYIVFVLAFFGVCYATRLIPIFAVAPVFLWMLVFFTWRYVSIEYKYTVERGMLTLYIVYGGKKKKQLDTLHIKAASDFLSVAAEDDPAAAFLPTHTYDLRSGTAVENVYAFVIERDSQRILVLLEAPEPSRKAILYYACSAVKEKTRA